MIIILKNALDLSGKERRCDLNEYNELSIKLLHKKVRKLY